MKSQSNGLVALTLQLFTRPQIRYDIGMASDHLAKKQRGAPLVAKILDAALVEIARVGPYDLSIEDVAKRADVNKTTIYRRWADPDKLAFAAFEHGSTTSPMPNTGSLRADVIQCLKLMREVCQTPAMLSLTRMQINGELTGELGAMVKARIECSDCDTLVMFKRALDRGELPQDANLDLVRDMVLGGAQYQLFLRNAALSDERIEQFVDMALAGTHYVTRDTVTVERRTPPRNSELRQSQH